MAIIKINSTIATLFLDFLKQNSYTFNTGTAMPSIMKGEFAYEKILFTI